MPKKQKTEKDYKVNVIYPENFDKEEFDERYKDFIYTGIAMILENQKNPE